MHVYNLLPLFSNTFLSETAWPIRPKFYVEPPWEGGKKIYINRLGHKTKMAAMPKLIKTLKNLLLQNQKSYDLQLGMYHWGPKLYKVYINDDPGLPLTYFTAWSNWVICTFEWGKLL